MKYFWLTIILIALSGCAAINHFKINLGEIRGNNRENILKINLGMSKQDVLTIMGTKTITAKYGYVITSPFRSDMHRVKGISLEILYFYTDKKSADGAITDDELTPVIIKNGKVDGWGWSYWKDLIKKNEIRIR